MVFTQIVGLGVSISGARRLPAVAVGVRATRLKWEAGIFIGRYPQGRGPGEPR
jgi:hypothetical protein